MAERRRSRPASFAGAAVLAISVGLASARAAAQERPAGVVPPSVVYAPEPGLTDDALAAGLTDAEVVVRATIDAEGSVTAAEVVQPVGHGLDAVALRAALEFRFTPARRDWTPVASRILLRVEFRAPPMRAARAEASPPPEPVPVAVAREPSALAVVREPSAVEVVVHGLSDAERLRRSAEAVHVVETAAAKQKSADLGDVLTSTQGVRVQRTAGLGSDTRVSLNGLTDDQVRFFLDGVPLEFAGFPFGIANVPVNLIERIEIYRGVVPIRFGADALGGAVNLVSDRRISGTQVAASYEEGSFGTLRLTASAQHLNEPSGWFVRTSAFLDRAENDYPMTVDVPNDRGHEVPTRVYRFHDGYRAEGARLETGVVGKSWADRLLVGAFVTHYDKEIQHNLLVTFNPYGDITLSELTAGGTVRYAHAFSGGVSVNAVAGYAYGSQHYLDVGECVYDWYGHCIRARPQPGERVGRAEDQLYSEHSGYGRVNVNWRLRPEHAVRLSVSPTYVTRTGDERRQANPEARDALSAERVLIGLVSGVEYQLNQLGERLENIVFLKDYLQVLHSEDPLSNGTFRREDRTTHRAGIGDSLRYAFSERFYAKASYEWATRLPRADEIFGNAFPIQPNLELEPELSHNVNLGATLDAPIARAGRVRADVNGFLRDADQLIVLVGNDQTASYQNVYGARSLGVEAAAGFTSLGDHVELDGNLTYADFRNTSTTGAFAANQGERIPNRPYLFGNASLTLRARRLAAARDDLALGWTTRYVHEFFRGWEGLGSNKLTVEAQLVHSASLTYSFRRGARALSFAAEIANVTDASAYDVFGVPRPGRAFYFKATVAL